MAAVWSLFSILFDADGNLACDVWYGLRQSRSLCLIKYHDMKTYGGVEV
jgi:hypothetical protein